MTLARNTDPLTSHLAIPQNVTKKQKQLLGLMVDGRTYISDEVDCLIPGIWRRIGECGKLGLISFTGNTRKGRSGRYQREFRKDANTPPRVASAPAVRSSVVLPGHPLRNKH